MNQNTPTLIVHRAYTNHLDVKAAIQSLETPVHFAPEHDKVKP